MITDPRHRVLVRFLVVSAAVSYVAAQGAETDMPMLRWASGEETPGICVDEGGWYVSVIPSTESGISPTAPQLVDEAGSLPTELLHFDPDQRLCLVEAKEVAKRIPVTISEEPCPKPGESLTCLAADGNCRTTVAGKEWSYRGQQFVLPLLRVRIADSEHDCPPGTALLNEDGNVAALLTAHELETDDEALAIPASRLQKLISDFRQFHRSGPVWFGLLFHNETSAPEVVEVKPGSPAEEAGIREGDVILSVNDVDIEDLDELEEVVRSLPAGEPVDVEVLRGLSGETVSVTPQFAEVSRTDR